MHPHCAAVAFPGMAPPRRSGPSPAVVVLGVVGGLFLISFLWGVVSGGASSSSTSSSRSTNATPKVEETPFSVDAKTLWDDYHANEVSADDRYKGRRLRVSGTVASIDKDFMDNIVIRLSTPNQFMGIMATMESSERSRAASMSKGQKVTVVCRGGGMIVGSPSLRDCTID
jgi:hypothetical protein